MRRRDLIHAGNRPGRRHMERRRSRQSRQRAARTMGRRVGAKVRPGEYGREYEVVQRELEKDMGEPDWVFYDLTIRNRYQVSPMRVPTIGYKEVIQGLSRDDVYTYYKKAYQPNNMVFAVAG